MKFSCTKENLQQALSLVSHIAVKDVNLPILSNILIQAKGGIITFRSTNLEMGVTFQLRGKVEEDGEYTVPARVLHDYVALLPNDQVDFVLDNSELKVSCGSRKTKIKGEPASDFPIIPEVEKQTQYTIPTTELLRGLQQVTFAAAMSESRPEISGTLFWFSLEEKGLIMTATDSYRLAERKIPLMDEIKEEKKIIVPVKTLQELQRTLSVMVKEEGGDTVSLALNDNQILFNFGSLEITSRIIEGQYPDYQSIIPTQHKTQVVVMVDDFLKAVKAASLFSQAGVNDVLLQVATGGQVTVSAGNAQVGESTTTLETSVDGPDQEVVLNYRYVVDGIQAIDATEVVINLVDSNNPVLLQPPVAAEPDQPRNYQYVVMPIKQ